MQPTMKTYSVISLFSLLAFIQFSLGCRETSKSNLYAAKKDSVPGSKPTLDNKPPIPDSIPPSAGIKRVVVSRGKFSNDKYTVYVSTIYNMPDKPQEDSSYYRDGNYLYIVNNKTMREDSIQLDEDPDGYVNISDQSALLAGASPLFRISWTGDSDIDVNQYWGFKDGTFQMLFDIESLVELKRVDEFTLRGLVMDRDELVWNPEEYPVSVSLKDFEVKIERPSNQQIGYPTTVVSKFTAYKVSDNKPYVLKAGAAIIIDSINRKTNTIRIISKDSTILGVPFSDIKGKIRENAAG
jgi:hypothetical protein